MIQIAKKCNYITSSSIVYLAAFLKNSTFNYYVTSNLNISSRIFLSYPNAVIWSIDKWNDETMWLYYYQGSTNQNYGRFYPGSTLNIQLSDNSYIFKNKTISANSFYFIINQYVHLTNSYFPCCQLTTALASRFCADSKKHNPGDVGFWDANNKLFYGSSSLVAGYDEEYVEEFLTADFEGANQITNNEAFNIKKIYSVNSGTAKENTKIFKVSSGTAQQVYTAPTA